ncbi:MAG: hypothetical protein RSB32_08105 [Mucinivorans sp.]
MIDIKQTPDGDIDLATGDIALIEPTEQHKADILMADQGDYKESPLTGVGLMEHINSENDGGLLRVVAQQMRRDGIKITQVGYDENGDLIIDGTYENNNGHG